MFVEVPDLYPGRCDISQRGERCLDYADHAEKCQFPSPKYPSPFGAGGLGGVSYTSVKPSRWVSPLEVPGDVDAGLEVCLSDDAAWDVAMVVTVDAGSADEAKSRAFSMFDNEESALYGIGVSIEGVTQSDDLLTNRPLGSDV